MTVRNRVLFSFLVWASCGHACKWTDCPDPALPRATHCTHSQIKSSVWASIPDVSSAVQVQLIYVADTIENIVMKIYQEKGCSYSHAELLRVLQSGHPGREFTKDEVCRGSHGSD